MLGEEEPERKSESANSQGPVPHAGDVAVAQRITAGDEVCWDTFIAAIWPIVTKAATNWCNRIASGAHCRACTPGSESACTHFSGAKAMIEDRIRRQALEAYSGQAALAVFIESLVGSDWWFWDYTDATADHLPIYTKPTAEAGYHADLVFAWAVLAGSGSAWSVFLRAFNEQIEGTAINWCHRGTRRQVCLKCKPNADDADQGCDRFGDAYVYILNRLRFTAFVTYCGRTALGNFVELCLHDQNWWKSFVQKQTHKIKVPKAIEDEPELVHNVYRQLCWGVDSERIAAKTALSIERVEETRARIEQKLRNAGSTLSPRKIQMVSLSAPGQDAENSQIIDPPSSEISSELRAEARKYWSLLPVQDRVLLRLRVASKKSVPEIASDLGISSQQVYRTIYRIRKEMPEWFKMSGARKNRESGPSKHDWGDVE